MDIMKAVLGFEDGDFVVGEGFGVKGECAGELVFNTQMTGYMESLTDPSYFGQILMFTFPQIGNYGVDPRNFQNPHVCALGCIAKEICEKPEHMPSIRTFFEENNLLGMTGVDTRALTIKARVHGTMRAALVVGSDDGANAVALAKKTPTICDIVPIPEVSSGTLTVSPARETDRRHRSWDQKEHAYKPFKTERGSVRFPIQRHIGSGRGLQA